MDGVTIFLVNQHGKVSLANHNETIACNYILLVIKKMKINVRQSSGKNSNRKDGSFYHDLEIL